VANYGCRFAAVQCMCIFCKSLYSLICAGIIFNTGVLFNTTAKMLSEVALCLLNDHQQQPSDGDALTPATTMGHTRVKRLDAADNGTVMQIYIA
jgi:hypothetical protein